MAKELKKDVKDASIETRLKNLYQLQTILSQIDSIKTMRGELPLEVQDLEDEIAGLNVRISKIGEEIASIKKETDNMKMLINTANMAVEKYKEQLDNVRNNHEYEALSKEIEYQMLDAKLNEKRITENLASVEQREGEIAQYKAAVEEKEETLKVKKSELNQIITETKAEEDKLREQAKVLESTIEPRLLQSFKRIRKNSRNGLGIVYVQRDACGGCFNKIPPQRQLDIRMRKKIIVCEYCGRIMIDPELAGVKEDKKAEEKPKRRRRLSVPNQD